MRSYFIESAKNLLKGEGLRSISVRHVAGHAGYSYATLYNYFKDLNELIFVCVGDFQKEAEEFVARKTDGVPAGRERIKAISTAYAEYFTEYPGVFELFFLEKMGNMGNKGEMAELIYTFLDRLCGDDWDACIKSGEYTPDEVAKMKDRLRFTLAGMLLYYENRMHPSTYEQFIAGVREQIDGILK